jgi:hypothetical protein
MLPGWLAQTSTIDFVTEWVQWNDKKHNDYSKTKRERSEEADVQISKAEEPLGYARQHVTTRDNF